MYLVLSYSMGNSAVKPEADVRSNYSRGQSMPRHTAAIMLTESGQQPPKGKHVWLQLEAYVQVFLTKVRPMSLTCSGPLPRGYSCTLLMQVDLHGLRV